MADDLLAYAGGRKCLIGLVGVHPPEDPICVTLKYYPSNKWVHSPQESTVETLMSWIGPNVLVPYSSIGVTSSETIT